MESNHSSYFYSELDSHFIAELAEQPIEKENSIQLKIRIRQNNKYKTTGKALVYLEKTTKSKSLKYGDLIQIKNTFKPILPNNNPYEFDYGRYLKIHSIYHQAYMIDKQWKIVKQNDRGLYSGILTVRKTLEKWITESTLSIQNQKVAKALLLGEKEHLDPSTLKSFSSAGAMHVLAVSGLHVGIIMLILQFTLRPIRKIKFGIIIYTALIISGVWLYALITGFSPSVIRAALMFSFIVFGMGLQRQNSVYQSIFVSAFIILLFDPFSLFKVGFQLSYLAVIGIVYIQPKIYAAVYFKNSIIDYVWKISAVSIAAQLATFPLGLYYFHQFPNLFLISNIIVIPLAGLLLCLGFIYFATHFILPIKIVLEYILDLLFIFLNKSMSVIEAIPNSLILGISISWIEVFLIYIILITSILGYFKKSKKLYFAFLFTLCAFLAVQFREQSHINQQNQLTCYNVKKDFALDLFSGTENTFVSTQSILEDNSKLLFHVKHNWYKNRGDKEPSELIDIQKLENPIFRLNEKNSLAIINSGKVKIPVVEYVILYNIDFLNTSFIENCEKSKTTLILHPDLPFKVAMFCKKNYPAELIFDIKEAGAFQLSYR